MELIKSDIATNAGSIGSGNNFNFTLGFSKDTKKAYLDSLVGLVDQVEKGIITREVALIQLQFYVNFSGYFGFFERKRFLESAVEFIQNVKVRDEVCSDNNIGQIDIIVKSIISETRTKEIETILKKALERITRGEYISLSTIKLLEELTDVDINKIKEIFRYVVGNSILKYNNISQDFTTKGFNQTGSDNIKFLNKIFSDQGIGGKRHPIKLKAIKIDNFLIWDVVEENFRKIIAIEKDLEKLKNIPLKIKILDKEEISLYITKYPISEGEIELNISCFVILTDMGCELYSLLKDEIKEYPENYLKSVVDGEEYKKFGLTFEIKN
jgi:hypothetical protein